MNTLGQAAKELDIPKGTIRQWVNDFYPFLSDNAKPPKGEVKLLDDNDMQVLWTVHMLRAKHKSKSDIAVALEKGERFYPESEPTPASDSQPPAGESAVTVYEAFTQTLQTYETRILTYEDEVRELHERLLESENLRVSAETELRIIKEQTAAQGENLTFWQRLFGKR